jgi:N-formylglutamate amidohydrolase
MQTLSEFEIIANIKQHKTFEANIAGGAFRIKVDQYQPSICTALHAGHRLRKNLSRVCALTETQRLYEEDPYTDAMIAPFPITLIGQDSRYEYDLNRALQGCVYTCAWDKQVWSTPLTKKQRERSRQKYLQFYRVLNVLIVELEQLFGGFILFDVHSYNYKRIARETPVFNVGTERIDMQRWGKTVQHFTKKLSETRLAHGQASTAQNDVFNGLGYLTEYVNASSTQGFALPVEVKKIYMDEESGGLSVALFEDVSAGLKAAIENTIAYSSQNRMNRFSTLRSKLLTGIINKKIVA